MEPNWQTWGCEASLTNNVAFIQKRSDVEVR